MYSQVSLEQCIRNPLTDTLNSPHNNQHIAWDNEVYLLITETHSYGSITKTIIE